MSDAIQLPVLWIAIGATYLAVGVMTAWLLGRRGVRSAVAVSALGCWPLLLPLLSSAPELPSAGPLSERIGRCAEDLRATMSDPRAEHVVVVEDLDELVADLRRADQRVGMVDALVADVRASSGDAPGLSALLSARARAAAEVEAVLEGMVELRLSIGLRSLAGNTVPVQERLGDLRARLGALDEIAAFDLERSV
ncbi:MAG: hypothetical protein ACRBN8_23935 [Nannocystales bacterium]